MTPVVRAAAVVVDGRAGLCAGPTEGLDRVGGHVNAPQSIASEASRLASRARTGTGPTDPIAARTCRLAVSTTTATLATEMTIALRGPILAKCCGPSTRGTRTAVTISPGRRPVRLGPVMCSAIGTLRTPSADAITTSASRAASHGSVSPAGLAVPTFPPTVPAFRICGEPTVLAAIARPGASCCRSRSIAE